ncbi:MAG: hypothetical protein M8357_14780 [Desulfobulbaceae bacterium]|nr:hypothetical protein [Desulfobulbaceae bacterium]
MKIKGKAAVRCRYLSLSCIQPVKKVFFMVGFVALNYLYVGVKNRTMRNGYENMGIGGAGSVESALSGDGDGG